MFEPDYEFESPFGFQRSRWIIPSLFPRRTNAQPAPWAEDIDHLAHQFDRNVGRHNDTVGGRSDHIYMEGYDFLALSVQRLWFGRTRIYLSRLDGRPGLVLRNYRF